MGPTKPAPPSQKKDRSSKSKTRNKINATGLVSLILLYFTPTFIKIKLMAHLIRFRFLGATTKFLSSLSLTYLTKLASAGREYTKFDVALLFDIFYIHNYTFYLFWLYPSEILGNLDHNNTDLTTCSRPRYASAYFLHEDIIVI